MKYEVESPAVVEESLAKYKVGTASLENLKGPVKKYLMAAMKLTVG